jgi:hypothetical protein
VLRSRGRGGGKALRRPPADKMVREGDGETKRPIPEDELTHQEPEPYEGIDEVVRRRGAWFPGDPT